MRLCASVSNKTFNAAPRIGAARSIRSRNIFPLFIAERETGIITLHGMIVIMITNALKYLQLSTNACTFLLRVYEQSNIVEVKNYGDLIAS